MLNRALTYDKNAISIRIKKFGLALKTSPPYLARANQLIFLCGANLPDSEVPSARREAIKQFVEGLSVDYHVIYAEGVFKELSKLGHKKNVLDLEHEISDIADKIIIVMESESAICELGAFAHQYFRNKLIIINDSKYKSKDSFINVGPIAAAEEVKAPVLWYPMAQTGIYSRDGIGATFKALAEAIRGNRPSRSERVTDDLTDLKPNKISIYFVHDLVLFTGPLSNNELIAVFKTAFGIKSYDNVPRLLGVLRAAGLIASYCVGGTWVYRSKIDKPFLKYPSNVNALMASFRNFHLLKNPERFRIGQ